MKNKLLFLEKYLYENYGVEIKEGGKLKISGKNAKQTSKAIDEFQSKMKQLHILYQSTLMSLAIYFEVLIASIIKQRMVLHPKSSDIEEKTLTLENIRKLGSFENAELFLIEQEVETIIRKSYTDWIDYLKKNMKLKMDYIERYNDKIIEIIQRRNLFVHNEGIVNSIYLKNIDPKLKEGVKLGERLSIDHAYIDESIDIVEHAGTLLGLEFWSVMEKRSDERVKYTINKGIDLMSEKNGNSQKIYFNSF